MPSHVRAVPSLSFIVIGFNERESAPRAMSAILAQDTDVPFELIYVDDGSTDGTLDVVRAEHGGDLRVRLVDLGVNQGRGAARRAGLAAARGELIAFCDSDIILPPFWARFCLEALEGHDAVGGIPVPDGDCAVLAHLFDPVPRVKRPTASFPGSNVMFRADLPERFPFPATRLGEDFRYGRTLAAAGLSLHVLPSVTVAHRETRTYGQGLRWLYASGVDASALLAEYRTVRGPDLAFFAVAGVSAAAALLASRRSPWLAVPAATATAFAGASAVGLAHAFSRFDPRPRPAAFARAAVANGPLMLAYLAGRTVGTARLLAGSSR